MFPFSVSDSLCYSVEKEWHRTSWNQAYCERSSVILALIPLLWLICPALPVLGVPRRRSLSLPMNPALLPGASQCLLQVACSDKICVTCQKNTSFSTSVVEVLIW